MYLSRDNMSDWLLDEETTSDLYSQTGVVWINGVLVNAWLKNSKRHHMSTHKKTSRFNIKSEWPFCRIITLLKLKWPFVEMITWHWKVGGKLVPYKTCPCQGLNSIGCLTKATFVSEQLCEVWKGLSVPFYTFQKYSEWVLCVPSRHAIADHCLMTESD